MASTLTSVQTALSSVSSTTAMNNVYLADTRVYICGVLVPVFELTITSGVENYPTAEFALPPDRRLLELGRMDKVPVHVFQRETYVESPNYVLMFYGYIVSASYQSSSGSRSVQFQAVSYYSLLDEVRVNFMSVLSEPYTRLAFRDHKIDSNEAFYVPADILMDKYNVSVTDLILLRGVDPSQTGGGLNSEYIKFPYQYISNVLNWLIKPWENSVAGTSDGSLFANASELAKIYGRYFKYYTAAYNSYCKLPYFDDATSGGIWGSGDNAVFPLLESAKREAALGMLFATQRASAAEQQTLRDLINSMSSSFEYEFSVMASPALISGTILGDICYKPCFADAYPPMCNVVFRSQVLQISYQEIFNTQPTRLRIRDTSLAYKMITAAQENAKLYDVVSISCYPNSLECSKLGMEDAQKLIWTPKSTANEISNAYASVVLAQEYFSGVHVVHTSTPPWYNSIYTIYKQNLVKKDDSDTLTRQQLSARLSQRLLMQASFGPRTIEVTTTFNPYITPGFPGVVFDSRDTGMAFAGYVLAVSHHISKGTMQTTFTMGYARPLEHAMHYIIRHPVPAMEDLLHDTNKMTTVYNAVLGAPVDDGSCAQVPGAIAASFLDIYKMFMAESSTSTGPQHDPHKAYVLQRRNIVTFEDFLTFMGFKVADTGAGPTGESVPLSITTDVSKTNIYERIFDDRLPIYVPVVATSKKTANNAPTPEESDNTLSGPDLVRKTESLRATEEGTAVPPTAGIEVKDTTTQSEASSDSSLGMKIVTPRNLLRAVAAYEFEHYIYS